MLASCASYLMKRASRVQRLNCSEDPGAMRSPWSGEILVAHYQALKDAVRVLVGGQR